MKKLLFFLLVIFSFSSKSQIPFSGIVTEQNSGYKALSNVQIKSEASNTISSDVKGNFNLLFQNKKEGDEIYLHAKKAGYELVNIKEMATKIPKRQTTPFRIVMCKAGLLAQNRAKYYEISEKYITRKYETELAKLNRSTEDWREKAAKLEANFMSSLEFAGELADRYSMMNLDDVSELQRKAFRLYEENKVDEALKILEGEDYQENIKQVKAEQKKIQDNTQLADNEISKAEEIIQHQISKLMFQADLYAQDFQFDKAEKTYEIAVEADTSNFNNTFNFGKFLYNQKEVQKAIFYFQRGLLLTKFNFNIANIHNNLGTLFKDINENTSSINHYHIAYSYFSKETNLNESRLYDYIVLLNNISRYYFQNYDNKKGVEYFDLAIKKFDKFKKNEKYQLLNCTLKNNLALYYLTIEDLNKAKKYIWESSEICDSFNSNSLEHKSLIAHTKYNIGSYFHKTKEYVSSLASLRSANNQINELLRNPKRFLELKKDIIIEISRTFLEINEIDSAKIYIEDGIKVFQIHQKEYPFIVLPHLIELNNQLSQVLFLKKDTINSKKLLINSLQQVNSLQSSLVTTNNQNLYIGTFVLLAKFHLMQNKIDSTTFYLEKAISYKKDLAKKNPEYFEMSIAQTLNDFGILFKNKKLYKEAINFYETSISLMRKYDSYTFYLSDVLNNLGNCYSIIKKFKAADSLLNQSLNLRVKNYKINNTLKNLIADSYLNLAILRQSEEKFKESIRLGIKSLDIYEELVKKRKRPFEIEFCRTISFIYLEQEMLRFMGIDSTTFISESYISYSKSILKKHNESVNLSSIFNVFIVAESLKNLKTLGRLTSLTKEVKYEKKYSNKVSIQKTIIEIYYKLNKEGIISRSMDIASNLSNLAWYQLFERQFKEAEQSTKEALNPTTFEKTKDYDSQIEWANTNLALALLFQGKYAEAEKIYVALKDKPYNNATYRETFLADLEELEKAGIMHPDVVKIKELLKK